MGVSLAKVARGGQRYYLEAVAGGIEDHRPPGGEPDGTWLGGATASLGLSGRVTADQLDAVLAGAHPGTGEVVSRTHTRVKVAGYDLVFSAPKSVSLLFALGDGSMAEQVLASHREAVDATVGHLEREAVRARRGSGGERRTVTTTGVVGAAFLHRTSRAPDPHLHTHVLVTNLVQDHDGRWSALDARGLYLHTRTAGFVYRAHLRQELTERLGLSWARTALGVIDIEGMDPVVVRAFSRRRADIESALADNVASSAKAAQVAALTTRPPKDLATSFESLVPQWRARAVALGLGPEQMTSLTRRTTDHLPAEAFEQIGPALVGTEGLTAHASSFSRQDVVRAVCEASLSGGRVAGVEATADRLLESNVVRPVADRPRLRSADTVRRTDGRLVWGGVDAPRWTTTELVAVEERMVESAQRRGGERIGLGRPEAVEAALARRPHLDAQRGQPVRALLESGAGVVTVAASTATLAGDGLDAAREAWEASGLMVLGTSPGPSAAGRLEAATGVESVPLRELLSSREGLGGALRSVGVLLVDQAGAVDSRTLDRLLAHAARDRVKVVLVSDPRQVGMADTGGWHRLADRLGSITMDGPEPPPPARLVNVAARAAHLGVETVAGPAGGSAVTVGPSLETVRQQVVEDWWEARRAGQRAVMVASRPVDVKVLNAMAGGRLAGERLAGAGELADNALIGPSEPEPAAGARRARTMDAEQHLVLGDSHMLARAGWSEESRAGSQLYVVDRGWPDVRLEHDLLDRMDRLADSLGKGSPGNGSLDRGPPPATGPASLANLSLADLTGQREALGARLSAAANLLPPDPGQALAGLDQDRARAVAGLSAARDAVEVSDSREPNRRQWGRWARRSTPDTRLDRVDPAVSPNAVARWEAELKVLDARYVELGGQAGQRGEWVAEHGDDLVRYRQLGAAIERRERTLGRAADARPPPYLVDEIGERPTNPTDRPAWRKAARGVESYRERWGVRTGERALDEDGMGTGRGSAGARGGDERWPDAGMGRLSRRAERAQAVGALEAARSNLQPERARTGLERPPIERSFAPSAGRGLG